MELSCVSVVIPVSVKKRPIGPKRRFYSHRLAKLHDFEPRSDDRECSCVTLVSSTTLLRPGGAVQKSHMVECLRLVDEPAWLSGV